MPSAAGGRVPGLSSSTYIDHCLTHDTVPHPLRTHGEDGLVGGMGDSFGPAELNPLFADSARQYGFGVLRGEQAPQRVVSEVAHPLLAFALIRDTLAFRER